MRDFLDADNVAAGCLLGCFDHIHQDLGLAGAFSSHDELNHSAYLHFIGVTPVSFYAEPRDRGAVQLLLGKPDFQIRTAVFIAGFPQKSEHILLVALHAGLIEGVDPQQVAGNGAGFLEEVDHIA